MRLRSKTISGFLLIFVLLCLTSSAQTYSSFCNVNDSLQSRFLGYAAYFQRFYIEDQNHPSKDSFLLDTHLLKRFTRAQAAVYNCDSLEGWGNLYADTARYKRFQSNHLINAPIDHCQEMHITAYDTSLIYMALLNTNGDSSGIPAMDRFISGYNIVFKNFYTIPDLNSPTKGVFVEAAGFFSYKGFHDSMFTYLWVQDLGPSCVGNPGIGLRFQLKGDTTYIQYGIGYGDCLAGCIEWDYYTYKVTPDCAVEFLNSSPYALDTSAFKSVIFHPFDSDTICADSVVLNIYHREINELNISWDNGSNAKSRTVYQSGTYYVNLYDRYTGKLIYWDTIALELIHPHRFITMDTSICFGDSLSIKSWHPNGVLDSLFFNNKSYHPDSLIIREYGNKVFAFTEGCGYTDSISVTSLPPLVISSLDSLYVCTGDSIQVLGAYAADSLVWSNGSREVSPWIDQEGKFVMTAWLGNCVEKDSIWIHKYPDPEFDLGRDTSLNSGDSLLFILPSDAVKIKWYDGDTVHIKWVKTKDLSADLQVYVDAQTPNGCPYTDSLRIHINLISIDEIPDLEIDIYPNPVNNLLYIYSEQALKTVTLILKDEQGRLCFYDNFKIFQTTNIDVSDLPKGIYFLTLINDKGIVTLKVVRL